MATSPPGSPPPAKKLKRDSSDSDEDQVDNATQKALEEIDSCQNQLDVLSEKASEAILKVEKKYNKMRKPLFDKRGSLLKKLPNFWVTVFVNHPQLTTFLDSVEEDCLHYLHKLEIEEFEDMKLGYKIKFHFEPNPYLENDVLIKELHLGNSQCGVSAFAKSTPIKWKEGKNLITVINERSKSKPGNNRSLENTSFFEWYVNSSDPSVDEIAEVIKDDIWTNPLQYFFSPDVDRDANGMPIDDDDDDDDDDGSEEEEEADSAAVADEAEDDNDEDDDEDDDEVVIVADNAFIENDWGLPKVIGVEPRVVEGEVREVEGKLEIKEEEEDLQDGEKILKDWEDVKEETNVDELELKEEEKESDEKEQLKKEEEEKESDEKEQHEEEVKATTEPSGDSSK